MCGFCNLSVLSNIVLDFKWSLHWVMSYMILKASQLMVRLLQHTQTARQKSSSTVTAIYYCRPRSVSCRSRWKTSESLKALSSCGFPVGLSANCLLISLVFNATLVACSQ